MSRNSPSVCIPSDAGATDSHPKRLLTKDGRNGKVVKQVTVTPVIESPTSPRQRNSGNRIGINQRMRILEKFVVGKTKIAIATEEGVDRETVRRIVKCPEMDSYVEAKRELWRGLCDPAIEVLRQKLKEGDKEVALRILESNSVIPPEGATFYIQAAAQPTGDERVRQLMEAFAAVAIERARVFKTPFPEIQEVADKIGVKLGFSLNGASNDTEEEEDNEI